jgi:hypothetical protein
VLKLKSRLKLWLRRYGIAEVCGFVTAFLGFKLGQHYGSSRILSAYLGTLGENVGFYGFMLAREIRMEHRRSRERNAAYGSLGVIKTLSHLGFEFGIAEAVDGLVVRPLSLNLATKALGDGYGVLTGKLAADLIFYVVAMIFYDLRQRHFAVQAGSEHSGGTDAS